MALRPWMTTFREKLDSARTGRSRQARQRNRTGRQSALETLETRTLLTSVVQYFNGSLIVYTDAGESIDVGLNPANPTQVDVRIDGMTDRTLSALLATAVTDIEIVAGSGANIVNASGVTAAAFVNLTSLRINGGDGDDVITGSADFPTSLDGGDGTDRITGGSANDTIDGGDGDDTVSGGAGNDSILGDDGNDSLMGDAGNDTIRAGDGRDTVSGGTGDDQVYGGSGADSLMGDAGMDELHGDHGNDFVSGGDDVDRVFGGADNDVVNGDAGDDAVFGNSGNDTLSGGTGNDQLDGDDGADSILGDAGDDILDGSSGNDVLEGGIGNDLIRGGGGNDLLIDETQPFSGSTGGVASDDTLRGHSGDDTLIGYFGADLLVGGSGNDRLETATVILPVITVTDVVSGIEGDTGTIPVTFTLTLNAPARGTEQVTVSTSDGTATAGSDYQTLPPTVVTFVAGQTTATVTVNVIGDTLIEGDEFFFLNLSSPVASMLGISRASAVIPDDDPLRLFAVFDTASEIVELDPMTGAVLNQFPTPSPTTFGPDGLAYDGNSIFFLAGQSTIFELNPDTGAVLDMDTFVSNGSFDGIATLNGIVYLADFANRDILIFDSVTDTITGTFDIDGLNSGRAIVGGLGAVSGGGGPDRLVATNFGAREIHEIDPATGLITSTFVSNRPGATTYYGTAALNGELYLGSNATGDIDVFDRAGNFLRTFNVGQGITALGGDGIVNNISPPPPPPVQIPTLGVQDDRLFGEDGNDTLLAGDYNDYLDGGAGEDSAAGGGGDDTIVGGTGNDTLLGGSGDDVLDGEGGLNSVSGGSGDDTLLWSSLGTDTLAGDDGGDTLVITLTDNADTVSVGQDSQHRLTITVGGRTVTAASTVSSLILNAGDGDDVITLTNLVGVIPSVLIVNGGLGNDTINASALNPGRIFLRLNGEDGDDVVTGSAFGDSITGGPGNDVINAGAGNDSVEGGDGNDTVNGEAGNDSVDGGMGNDVLSGGDGDDTLEGSFNNDTLEGDAGNDLLRGGFGDDSVVGSFGDDTLEGGAGQDFLRGSGGNDLINGGRNDDTINGNGGDDTIDGDHGNDNIRGGAGNDEIVGGDGNDTVRGEEGNDSIAGNDGNDHLSGDAGDDLLVGGDGDDTLRGGAQNDTLIGNDGADSINGNGDNSGAPNREIAVPGEGGDPAPRDVDEVQTEEEAFTPQLLAILAALDGR